MFIKKFKNKRGQTGETLTWIIATLIIIVILLIVISIANFMGNNKKFDYVKKTDTLASKSLFAYLLTEDTEGQTVYEQLKETGNFTKFNGELAVDIFKKFYGGEFQQVWFGISNYNKGLMGGTWNGESNNYFGNKPKSTAVGQGGVVAEKNSLSIMIHKEENSIIELLFVWGLKS